METPDVADASAPLAKNEDSPRGFAFALTAYLLWGFLPIYMKAVAHISPAFEVIAHRIVWSLPLAGIAFSSSAARRIVVALRSPRMLAMAMR
jgi:chloramphenicol-sensitive protein RarD